MEQRLYNQKAAAQYIGVSWQHLRRLVSEGAIPQPLKRTGGNSARKYYRKEWLESYIANMEQTENKQASADAKAQEILEG